MLSDEEKQAMEVLNYIKNKTPFIFWYEDKPYNRKETVSTILNLIDKQSKEIEELKGNECVYKDTSSCTKALSFKTYKKLNDIDKKWEDKIKAKIEEVHYKMIAHPDVRIAVELALQSLLEKE